MLSTYVFRHVVMGVYSNGIFGTVGLSRRSELMYKQMKFEVSSFIHIINNRAYWDVTVVNNNSDIIYIGCFFIRHMLN